MVFIRFPSGLSSKRSIGICLLPPLFSSYPPRRLFTLFRVQVTKHEQTAAPPGARYLSGRDQRVIFSFETWKRVGKAATQLASRLIGVGAFLRIYFRADQQRP
jgi:hypothetical protein